MLRASVLLRPKPVSASRFFTSTVSVCEGRPPTPLRDTTGINSKEKTVGNVNYHPDFLHAWTPKLFKKSVVGLGVVSGLSFFLHPALAVGLGGFTGVFAAIGFSDMKQKRHTIRRNFPVVGHLRYLFETLRPGLYQYFIESDTGGVPFNREKRGMAYQRSKNIDATMPFGTKMDVSRLI
jgi:hypothetical protein